MNFQLHTHCVCDGCIPRHLILWFSPVSLASHLVSHHFWSLRFLHSWTNFVHPIIICGVDRDLGNTTHNLVCVLSSPRVVTPPSCQFIHPSSARQLLFFGQLFFFGGCWRRFCFFFCSCLPYLARAGSQQHLMSVVSPSLAGKSPSLWLASVIRPLFGDQNEAYITLSASQLFCNLHSSSHNLLYFNFFQKP